MDEQDFWASLEYRVCREFEGMADRRLRSFWCDGFIPCEYLLNDPWPRITGQAWICKGPIDDKCEFALILPRTFNRREEIDWASLFPAEDVTRWMTFDEGGRYIELDPAAAAPDLPEPGAAPDRGHM